MNKELNNKDIELNNIVNSDFETIEINNDRLGATSPSNIIIKVLLILI